MILRANQVLTDPSEHPESLDYQVKLVKLGLLENLAKLDLPVFLVNLVFQAKQARKAHKVHLVLRANKDLSVHQDYRVSPAKEVLLDYL